MSDSITPSDAEKINNYAEERGEDLVEKGVTSSQLRRIYTEIKRAQTQYRSDGDAEAAKKQLRLLKPKLAYAASRDDGEGMEELKDRIEGLMRKWVDQEDNLDYFFEVIEAIVAYHQYHERGGAE
jgi:CRISPR-associated protein Csm2